MKKALVFTFFFISLFCVGQTHENEYPDSAGIQFIQTLSWDQIKTKAKQEGKYIFVDCFATWCGPCKIMDNETYPNDSVGRFMYNKFISVKIQMDRTKKDIEFIQKWYKDADAISREYKISGFPTFLFFSPDGSLVSKETGYKNPEDFITIARKALRPGATYINPYKVFDSLIARYKMGKKDYSQMPYMIKMAKEKIRDGALTRVLISDYSDYLGTLKKEKLYNKIILDFISSNTDILQSKFLGLFYPENKRVDKTMCRKGFSQAVADDIIRQLYVQPIIDSAMKDLITFLKRGGKKESSNEPDWDNLSIVLEQNYSNDYVERNLLWAKINWYSRTRIKMAAWRACFFTMIEKYGIQSLDRTDDYIDLTANVFAWEGVFIGDNDMNDINKASRIMKTVVDRVLSRKVPADAVIDTYANLLYKKGDSKDAIIWEEKALQYAKNKKYQERTILIYQETLDKMKNGKPTWSVPGS